MNIPKIWELYLALAKVVKQEHLRAGLVDQGHDFDHALRVGQMALRVAWPYDQDAAKLAGIAGLCHNADRIIERLEGLNQSLNVSEVPDHEVIGLVGGWLDRCVDLGEGDRGLVIRAVLHHGSKPNSPDDPLVLVALTDADRLVNLEADVIPRTAVFHYNLPFLDPVLFENDPEANYRMPKTVFWDLNNARNWVNSEGPWIIRLPEARKLAHERAQFLADYFDLIKRQRAEAGLIPYPKF